MEPKTATTSDELAAMYSRRFGAGEEYRNQVWKVLVGDFFQSFIPPSAAVLDLGCGFGQFINHVTARAKFGMDLNSATRGHLDQTVSFLQQDCSAPWPMADESLDIVFTSNFFEHLPNKDALAETIEHAHRKLKPGGRLIAMGPNLKYVGGAYWDFWDHHLPLTHLSMQELLELRGFVCETVEPRFLPYTMVNAPQYPLIFMKVYLRIRLAWRFFGQQFLIVARKPEAPAASR